MTTPSVRRAVTWLGGAVFASAVLQYALFFAAAAHLGAAAYGGFSLAWTIAVLLAPLCDLGTSVALVRTGSQRPLALSSSFAAALLLRARCALPATCLGLGIGAACGYGGDFPLLFVLLFAGSLADGVGTLCSAACQARERMRVAAIMLLARNVLRGLALLATLLAGGGAVALAVAFAVASVAAALPCVRIAAGGQVLPWRDADVGGTVRDALPFGIAILATIAHAQIDVALLGALCDSDEVGRYHASMRFVLLLQMVPQVLATAAAPLSYRQGLAGVEASARLYRLKATTLGMLGALAAVGLATCGDLLVRLLLGERFAGSEMLLIALAPVVFVKFVASALVDTLGAMSRQRRLCAGCCAALALNVVANLCLVPALGASGAVVATLVSEGFLLVFVAANVLAAGVQLDWQRVLLHPLLACAAAVPFALTIGPLAALLAAVLTAAVLVLRRPTAEERTLLRLPAGAANCR